MSDMIIELKIKKQISSDLDFLGVPTSQKGFSYLCESIFFAVKHPKALKSIKAQIIPKIAEMFSAKCETVERSMRHSLEAAYFKNTLKNINKLIGFEYLSPYEKPSLTHFVSLLAERHIILYNKLLKENRQQILKSPHGILTPARSKKQI